MTNPEFQSEYSRFLTRRWFFKQCGVGMGAIALAELLNGKFASAATTSANPLAPKKSHFPAKAKRVIYLFMAGGPSHIELFDNKPELSKWDGKLPPSDLLKGYRAAVINPNSNLLGPKFAVAKHGQSGAEVRVRGDGQCRRRAGLALQRGGVGGGDYARGQDGG